VLCLLVVLGGAALVSVSVARRGARAPRVLRFVSVGLLVSGGLAFAVTRRAAADARRLVPLWAAPAWPYDAVSTSALPQRADAPPEALDGPVVLVTADDATFGNGARVSDVGAFVRSALEAWPLTHPPRRFAGAVYLAAPSASGLRDVAGVVSAIRAGGAKAVRGVVGAAPRDWASRTLGNVARTPRVSSVPIGDAPTDTPETWGGWLLGAHATR
jgi:hypothetical protein